MPAEASPRRGVVLGLAAAVSFGVSAPLAKVLLDVVRPQMLAGLLYVGAFLALSLVGRRKNGEAALRRADLPRLGVMIAIGGVLAPVLLLLGLDRVSGVSGSLLLNLEGPVTIVIGVFAFREHLPRPSAVGAVVIFAGALLLGTNAGNGRADLVGVGLVAAACVCWAIDNNLTQSLTVRDPQSLVRIKAGVAGSVNVFLAFAIGERLPVTTVLLLVLVLGAVSYGLSVYLDALALRALGAAREAAVFAVAPFAGALLAPLVLPESFGLREAVAGVAMVFGVWVLLSERHTHTHRHEPLVHEHLHVHDMHHRHTQAASTAPDEPHSHQHRHEAIAHAHPHVSDVHHRHTH